MKRLSKKLHSECGASILMALLLLLVCMMVAASILGAAASNAGKYRSNRVEQQKYLTLSSALNLVIDEIKQAKYTWGYTVYEWTVDEVEDASGNIITPKTNYFYVKQDMGGYSCGDLTAQIPLKDSLEGELSKQFKSKGSIGYVPLSGTTEEDKTVYTLLVTLPENLIGYPYIVDADNPKIYEISRDVTVKLELDHTSHNITLTAWLEDRTAPANGSDAMTAELVAKNPPKLDYNPGDRTGGTPPNPYEDSNPGDVPSVSVETPKTTTATMQWELNWIRKGAA